MLLEGINLIDLDIDIIARLEGEGETETLIKPGAKDEKDEKYDDLDGETPLPEKIYDVKICLQKIERLIHPYDLLISFLIVICLVIVIFITVIAVIDYDEEEINVWWKLFGVSFGFEQIVTLIFAVIASILGPKAGLTKFFSLMGYALDFDSLGEVKVKTMG